MELMLRAVDNYYLMPMQYKYCHKSLKEFGQWADVRISKNFTDFINWMEKNFSNQKFMNVLGKSSGLSNTCLLRIPRINKKTRIDENNRKYVNEKVTEKWLMSDIIQYVENPERHKYPDQKYIGKIRLTKIKKGKFHGDEDEKWNPHFKQAKIKQEENRDPVDDIEIVVYSDDKMMNERRYETEHGWSVDWYTDRIYELGTTSEKPVPDKKKSELFAKYQDFLQFEQKWKKMKDQLKVPGWYNFDPRNPYMPNSDHNMMKAWDSEMFNYLKEQKWLEETSDHVYREKSEIIIDCSQILGIGGEAIVIRVPSETSNEYNALKIIPILKHNFEDNKIEEMQTRVDARQEQADPENFFPPFRSRRHRRQDRNQIKDNTGINSPKEISYAQAFLKKAENVEMMNEDAEIAENHGTEFEHDSLMSYSNIQLDYIKLFGEKNFFMIICKPIETISDKLKMLFSNACVRYFTSGFS